MLIGSVGLALAQDDGTGSSQGSDEGYAAKAGDFSGAILYGRGLFINANLVVPYSGEPVPGASPNASPIISDDNDATNMMGGEARYFILDHIAIKLGGAAIIRNTPDRPNIPAPQQNGGNIPDYEAVVAENTVDMTINLGGEYHFGSKYERLFPYLGLNLPFYYARRSLYDPTITGSGTNITITDEGPRHVQLFGFGGQIAAGVDYYLMEGFFFGFELKPVSYIYLYSSKIPAPGMEELQADTHTISFFTQPVLKVGFRF